MGHHKTSGAKGLRATLALSALLASLALPLCAPAPAFAEEETHAFDPVLSVTGRCTTDTLDSVIDPGCPYSPPPEGPQPLAFPAQIAADVAVDPAGYTYARGGEFEAEWFSVFDPGGHWMLSISKEELIEALGEAVGELAEPDESQITNVEVDSLGNLYAQAEIRPREALSRRLVVRYTPSLYPPGPGTTYGSPSIVFDEGQPFQKSRASIGVDGDDRLYLDFGRSVDIYGSAAEGNTLLREGIGSGTLSNSKSVAVGPGPRFDVYASGLKPGAPVFPHDPLREGESPFVSEVYVFDGETGEVTDEISGADIPNCAIVEGEEECGFSSIGGGLDVAVDRAGGDVFVTDKDSEAIYEFRRGEGGAGEYEFVSKITHTFKSAGKQALPLAFDNGASSPNRGYLYTAVQVMGIGHVLAFGPVSEIGPPIVAGQAVSGLSASEATLRAEVDPNGAPTRYSFEYVDEASYLADIEAGGPGHGFDHAVRAPVPDASLPSAGEGAAVFWPATGLSPGTAYRFRAVAENCDAAEPEREECTTGGGAARFVTYPAPTEPSSCSNEALRTGPSALLPDCRAYELVTPPDTNGLAPGAFTIGVTASWSAPLASPSGESVLFVTMGGSLPGYESTGSLNADGYRARRDPSSGWHTEAGGPSGAQSQAVNPGSPSAGHEYWVWNTFANAEGSLISGANYLRLPDGRFELVGRGSLAPAGDPDASPRFVSPGAGHIVFTSEARLEEGAPPAGTTAIYDRSPGGPTEVVSLLPGGGTPADAAAYQGASADGSAVAFKLGEALYVRVADTTTLEVTGASSIFAGLSRDGSRLVYVQGGDIFVFDTATGTSTQVGSGGESTPVNVSVDGSAVYFVSPQQLDGAAGEAGEDNLYVWDAQSEAVRFIAELLHSDVTGQDLGDGKTVGGLGLWTSHGVGPGQSQFSGISSDPSRTTPDGGVFLFESGADLTGESSGEQRQVYRYDDRDRSLTCVSCDPTLVQPPADAKLALLFDEGGLLNPLARLANLSADGKRVFFESSLALVPTDVNGVRDVYEWRARGVDGCQAQKGCLAPISSGRSPRPSYLWGASADGHDVFFYTSSSLVPADEDETPSIYDARIGGGFAPPAVRAECLGEACQPAVSAPNPTTPASSTFHGAGDVRKAGRDRCATAGRRATRLRRRAGKLARRAKRVGRRHPRRARAARRRARRFAHRSQRLFRHARHCRAGQRKRANLNRRVTR